MFIKDIILEGDEICLIPYEAQYLDEYFNIYQSKKQLQNMVNQEPNLSLSNFQQLQEEWDQDQFQQCLLIRKKDNNKIIGDVNFIHQKEMDEQHVEIQLSLFHEKEKHSNIGKEVLHLAEQYVRTHLKCDKIIADVKSNYPIDKDFLRDLDYKQANSDVFSKKINQSYVEKQVQIQFVLQ